MTSAPERHAGPLALLLAALLALAGCGAKEVVVQGQFPEPLMSRLPLTLGVWYDEAFREHEFFDEAKGRAESDWLVRTGEAQVQLWDTLLGGMFERVVYMDARPAPAQMNPAVDAVLIPRVDELQYAIPAQTNIKVYEIWMRYAFELVNTKGEAIADWTMTAYGKTPTAFLQSDEAAVNLAAVVALRDAGAHFATSFTRVPEVAAWMETLDAPTAVAAGPGDAP
ncbi:MAG TPA: hypothetical protein VJ947_08195 [Pseudohaliea sp.]|nr:hypothetical protein [Pseudohaliea sp.]